MIEEERRDSVLVTRELLSASIPMRVLGNAILIEI